MPNVSKASNNLTIAWQGTHFELIKFMTNAKESKFDLDIHKSNVEVVVTRCVIKGNINHFIVLANMFVDKLLMKGKSHFIALLQYKVTQLWILHNQHGHVTFRNEHLRRFSMNCFLPRSLPW
jgi:hypothetical protein